MDRAAADAWIRAHVEPAGAIETAHQRPWATVLRVPLANGVPDLGVATLPARYEELLRRDLPLEPGELGRLRGFAPRFVALCGELAGHDVPETVQHDDLHMAMRVGIFAHAFAWARQRDYLPEAARPDFDRAFAVVLRRAVARTLQ